MVGGWDRWHRAQAALVSAAVVVSLVPVPALAEMVNEATEDVAAASEVLEEQTEPSFDTDAQAGLANAFQDKDAPGEAAEDKAELDQESAVVEDADESESGAAGQAAASASKVDGSADEADDGTDQAGNKEAQPDGDQNTTNPASDAQAEAEQAAPSAEGEAAAQLAQAEDAEASRTADDQPSEGISLLAQADTSTTGFNYTVNYELDDTVYISITGYDDKEATDLVIPASIDGYTVTAIGPSAFCDCDALASVTLPDTVTTIGESAFCDCDALASVALPAQLASIGGEAFYSCGKLEAVELPASVASIGNWAFCDCGALKSFWVPGGSALREVGIRAFDSTDSATFYVPTAEAVELVRTHGHSGYNTVKGSLAQGGVRYWVDGDHAVVAGLQDGSLTRVTVPEELGGLPATELAPYAFSDADNLISVTLPSTLESVSDLAFYDSDGLESITLPDSVTSIGAYAFSSCDGLVSVELPHTLTSISDHIFYDSDALASVTLPDTVTTIGESAFCDCDALASVTLPAQLASIGGEAFYSCGKLEAVVLPASVASIGNLAFYDCGALKSFWVPGGSALREVGYRAFDSTDSATFYVPTAEVVELVRTHGHSGYNTVKGSLAQGGVRYWVDGDHAVVAGLQDGSLTRVTVPEELGGLPATELAPYAFSDADNLISVTLPSTLESVSDHAFYYQSNLLRIVIPAKVASIGEYAFYYCTSLAKLTFASDSQLETIGKSAFYYCIALKEVTLPDNIRTVGDTAFNECRTLAEFMAPESITTIGSGVFNYCPNIVIHCYANTPMFVYALEQGLDVVVRGVGKLTGEVIDYDTSYYRIDSKADDYLNLVVHYQAKEEYEDLLSNQKLVIRLPKKSTIVGDVITVDGKLSQDYTKGSYGYIYVPVGKDAGTVSLSVKPDMSESFVSYAQYHCSYGKYEQRDVVNSIVTDLSQEFGGGETKSLEGATVSVASSAVYTGAAIEPDVAVTLDGVTLMRDVSYTVSYDSNVNVGTATVTITGAGNYCGTATASFAIVPASIASAKVSGLADVEYTGAAIEPVVSVSLGGKTLVAGTDYAVSYKDNVEVGTATVVVSGKGNYGGTAKATFQIVEGDDPTPSDISGATVTVAEKIVECTGEEMEPEVVVTLGGETLVEDADYTVAYENNVNVGTATVIVTGIGDYTGTARVTFQIVEATDPEPTDIATAVVRVADSVEYTGEAVRPTPTVTLDGEVLVAGTDYTVAYGSNVNVGTCTVTITGAGDYTGSTKTTFSIVPASIAGATIGGLGEAEYTGESIEPAVSVSLGGRVLVEDTDYLVSYRSNVSVGTARVIVSGIGNYTGTARASFEIVDSDTPASTNLVDATLRVGSRFTYTGKSIEPTVSVTLAGTTLKENVDYLVSYKRNMAVGTAMVIVSGMGDYTGTASATFQIASASIAKSTVASVGKKTYTGKAIEPSVTVKLGGTVLVEDVDYVLSYKNNRKVGSATVVISGIGNYTGTKTAKFSIAKAKQPMTAKAAKKTAKLKTLKKKAVTLTKCVTVSKAQGKVTYKNVSTQKVAKKFKVNASTGKITVPKGTKKGTYQVKVKVTAAGNANYTSGSKTVTVKVTVK